MGNWFRDREFPPLNCHGKGKSPIASRVPEQAGDFTDIGRPQIRANQQRREQIFWASRHCLCRSYL
jgi:hypothetical protein